MDDPRLLRGRTILVIDDDADVRDMWRRLLERRGAHVMVAADGLEGLVHLEARLPDAILCDLTMPIMDGFEFASRMRTTPRYRKVLLIAVTGRQQHTDFADTWRAGFDGHLVKPVAAEALEALVQRLARRTVPHTGECA